MFNSIHRGVKWRNLAIKPTILLILLATASIWNFHERCLSIMTPRYLIESLDSRLTCPFFSLSNILILGIFGNPFIGKDETIQSWIFLR